MRTQSRILCLCVPAIILPSVLGSTGCGTAIDEESATTSAAATTVSANEKTACAFFVGKGLTPVQAAGIVGNLQQESTVDPRSVQYNGGPGRGIAQWSVGGRWDSGGADSATSFAKRSNADVWSFPLQLEFIWYELTTYSQYGLAKLRAAGNVNAATLAFQDLFEICGACDTSNRVAQANAVLAVCGAPGPSGGGTGAPAPASCSGLEDGAYCGGHDIGGDPGSLYTCHNGALSSTNACASGCKRNPGSEDDACAAAECPGTPGGTSGAIHDKYVALGECHSILGGPTTAETGTPDGIGRYNVFQNGSIYWTADLGAFEVNGAIRDRWAAVGWESGVLGYPTSDEIIPNDHVGRYNTFQKGAIFWSPTTNAHEVHGAIYEKWATLGREAGALGYPTSGEYAVSGGRQNDFEHGSIRWDSSSGQTTVTSR